ncbi:MAG: RagB/SusD family nutrient uptake outer membrane protein [Dysgonamonadaceae bacterium]|jgi:hypothetical protein|nr:RagB/SusD family nutrient uptake outer membrane protein [Dysgonamonadaceae bacterium]
MIKKYLSIITISVLLIAFTSCDDFLSEKPSKTTSLEIKTVEHLDAILENYSSFYQIPSKEAIAGHDDFGLTVDLYNARPASFSSLPIIYCSTWDVKYFPFDAQARGSAWSAEYGKIFRANLVLEYLDKVSGTDEQKSRLRAEAHLVRAYSLLELVHTYCLPYTEETKNELGLALKQSVSFEELSHRATLAETYALLESDIEKALEIKSKLVQNDRVRHWRGNIGAANALAARYWLGRGDYAKAETYAQAALNEYDQLLDYNTEMRYSSKTETPRIYNDPSDLDYYEEFTVKFPYTYDNQTDMTDMIGWREFYYFRLLNYDSWWYIPSQELVNLYNHDYDLRFKYHYVDGYSYISPASMNKPAYRWYGYIFFFKDRIPAGPTVAEMLLTKAECQARRNDVQGAMATVNILRAKRIDSSAPANEINLSASSRQDAIVKILEERRREMPFYIRRFDIRRFYCNTDDFDDVTITKTFFPYSNTAVLGGDAPVQYTIGKGDRRWASPILNTDIVSSQGKLQQNTY